jgi:hypothetical protein
MKSYNLEFSKTLTQVLFLVLYPILSCVLFFGALMLFDDFFTQSELILPSIIAFLVLLLGSSVLIVKRFIVIPATLKFDEKSIRLKLNKRNMFYHFNSIECGWENVKNVSANFDKTNNRHFLLLSFKSPGGNNILFTLKKADDAEIDEIWKEMNECIKGYNKKVEVESKITHRGFYAGPFMRLLSYAGICMVIAFSIILLYSPAFRTTENILKLVALLAFLVPFLVNYLQAQKREADEKRS